MDQYLADVFDRPYAEGVWDCMIFAALWVDLVSGSALAQRVSGTYKSKIEGFRRWGCPADAVRRQLESVGWKRTQGREVGDVVMTDLQAPGIWTGDAIAALAFCGSGHALLHPRHGMEGWRCPK